MTRLFLEHATRGKAAVEDAPSSLAPAPLVGAAEPAADERLPVELIAGMDMVFPLGTMLFGAGEIVSHPQRISHLATKLADRELADF